MAGLLGHHRKGEFEESIVYITESDTKVPTYEELKRKIKRLKQKIKELEKKIQNKNNKQNTKKIYF